MIDPTVQQLLETAIDTPCKLHIVVIFNEHPRLKMTAVKLAEWCCRDIWSVAQALHELTEDGILRVCAEAGSREVHYCLMPRSNFVEPFQKLMRGYDDPIERDSLQRSIRDLAAYAPFRRSTGGEYQASV